MSAIIDPILASISEERLRFIEGQLSTNRSASDDELHDLFVDRGLTVLQATRAICYRQAYLQNRFLTNHTPILSGPHALRFNPERRQVELFRC